VPAMQRPDIRTLETFVAVVETGSFSRAAEKLETTPGALSRRVSALERRLGLRLLNRTTRKISLTEAGSQYYADLNDILDALTEAENRISLNHACLHYSNLGVREEWTLLGENGVSVVEVDGPLCANNGDVLREAALRGMGIASLPNFIVAEDLAAGRLRRILPGYRTRLLPLSALWPSRRFAPAKVRVFVDYLAQKLG